ncbi:MAG TPA: leucine-rich repeat domain-containing protein, partial [Candidatus Acidoferrales bacterium]|nr:leucine-rich repeat domain-containing protein [Candidatus Acidoferrales bacterium]
ALVQYPQGKTGDYYAVPAGIQTVASGAFYGCTGLTNLSLPASLKNIGDTAFYGCANLAAAPLPDGVTNVGLEAFQNCESLTQVEIPDSVTSLGQQAFYGCGSITNVTIGNGVPGIGDSTFTDCTNLLSVTLGDQVATIGYAAFAYCVSLTNVTLGSDVTNIGESAFSYCFDLPSIVIPEGVTTIGSQAFLYCSSLASINLPASMTNFGDRVFEFCGNLGAITVDPDNVAYLSVDGVLFDQQQARLVQYPINNPRSHYTIPNGTLSVADTAFVSAYYLTSVTIPASVASLETLAFYNCPEVVGFFFQGNAPALGDNVFDLDDAATVYYLNGTTNWSQTFGGLPTALWNPQVQVPPAAMALQPFGFTITGAANMPVVVEASTNLVDGSWTVIESAVLTNGSFNFLDAQSTNYSGRYYRIRSP